MPPVVWYQINHVTCWKLWQRMLAENKGLKNKTRTRNTKLSLLWNGCNITRDWSWVKGNLHCWNKLPLNCRKYCLNWKFVQINWKSVQVYGKIGFKYQPFWRRHFVLYDVLWLPLLSENNSSFVVEQIQDGGARVILKPKWRRFVASFFVNSEIILLGFQQIFGKIVFPSI